MICCICQKNENFLKNHSDEKCIILRIGIYQIYFISLTFKNFGFSVNFSFLSVKIAVETFAVLMIFGGWACGWACGWLSLGAEMFDVKRVSLL